MMSSHPDFLIFRPRSIHTITAHGSAFWEDSTNTEVCRKLEKAYLFNLEE